MRYLIFTLVCGLLTSGSAATVSLDLKVMDSTLAKIAVHAQNFPPHFSGAAEREQTMKDLFAALKILDAAVVEYPGNPELLFRDGFANAMGQHLDVPGCDQKFIAAFEEFLKLKPNDRKGNFLYGGFLASTATHQAQSIKYLVKAVELGETDAHYTLAFVYLSQMDKAKAISHLRQYAKANPGEANGIEAKIAQIEEAKIHLTKKPPVSDSPR
jgi:tetratricopeptide (TPR) repeat protein